MPTRRSVLQSSLAALAAAVLPRVARAKPPLKAVGPLTHTTLPVPPAGPLLPIADYRTTAIESRCSAAALNFRLTREDYDGAAWSLDGSADWRVGEGPGALPVFPHDPKPVPLEWLAPAMAGLGLTLLFVRASITNARLTHLEFICHERITADEVARVQAAALKAIGESARPRWAEAWS